MIAVAVRHFLVKAAIFPTKIVVAVSGGVDSTALLLALSDLRDEGLALLPAHVNHHLRGQDSDDDEHFVRTLCEALALPLEVADGTLDPVRIRAVGVEAAAREARYTQLSGIRDRSGMTYVATAHQKNDQAETVLMRLLTGSGINGLRGIHPVRDDGFIRPLLEVTREEIEQFLRDRNVTPRVDASNADPRFLRNRVRGIVHDHGAVDALAGVAAQARLQWQVLEQAIDQAERESVEVLPDETRFVRWPENPWLRQALLHRHIRRLDPASRDVSSADLERLERELDGVVRISVTATVELVLRHGLLVLRRKPEPRVRSQEAFEVAVIDLAPAYIPPLGISVHVAQSIGGADNGGRQLIQLPPGALPAFVVRNRRPGDRFHPLGLGGSKKLKDFLIDRRIAAEVRDRLPLLLWNDEIVWVAEVEVSDRFKVTTAPGDRYEVWLEESRADDDRDHIGDRR